MRRWPFVLALASALAAAVIILSVPPPGPEPVANADVVREGLRRFYVGDYRDADDVAQFTVTLHIAEIRSVEAGSRQTAAFRRAAPELGAGLYFTGRHQLSGSNFPRPTSHPVAGYIDPASGRAVIIPMALSEAAGDDYPGAFVGWLAHDMDAMDLVWLPPDGTSDGRLLLERH